MGFIMSMAFRYSLPWTSIKPESAIKIFKFVYCAVPNGQAITLYSMQT